MVSFNSFIELLLSLQTAADQCGDKYENLILEGSADSQTLHLVDQLFQWAVTHSVTDALNLTVDEEYVDASNLTRYIDESDGDPWKLVISKSALQPAYKTDHPSELVFFLDPAEFNSWVENIDPLKNPASPVKEGKRLFIYTPTVTQAFGGPFLAVMPLSGGNQNIEFTGSVMELPLSEKITQFVHLVPTKLVRITPQCLSLSWGEFDQDAAKPFRKASAIALAASMVDVIYGPEKAVIKGMRHLEVPLYNNTDIDISRDHLGTLEHAVSWLYEERTDTRRRLLGDRISLDADKNKSLLENLVEDIKDSFEQACDQYRFVVLDRKDEYVRERRELLKDIRKQAEIYAEKTRSLIAGFSRDALAAFVFAGLSLSRIVDSDELKISQAGNVFFKTLAVYFLISIALQFRASWRDIDLSNNELSKWSHVTRDYLPKKEVDTHINEDLKGRKQTFWNFMILISLIYLVLAALSWNLESVINCFSTG